MHYPHMKEKIRIIFFGTPLFSVPFLEALVYSQNAEVISVVTQMEKPAGRGLTVTKSSIAQYATEHNIPVQTFEKLKNPEVQHWLSSEKPDMCIVVAYGKIIPGTLLQIPPHGFLNVHGSLLPKYRGASPIQYALWHGEKETGITFMKMNEKMDEGDILKLYIQSIDGNDTYETLSRKLALLGSSHLEEVLISYIRGTLKSHSQEHDKATYTTIITREMGQIDWKKEDAVVIHNKLRAFTPWPGIFTFLNGKRLKIITATVENENQSFTPGHVIDKRTIGTLRGLFIPKIVQLEGKKPVEFWEFLCGIQQKDIIFQ